MNLHHKFERPVVVHSSSSRTGFILPALVVFSLVLASMGVVALQYITASTNAIQSTNFRAVAKSAADAGLQHALSCLDMQNEDWVSLTPDIDCTGAPTGADNFMNKSGAWTSTYTVAPTEEHEGQLLVTSTGTVEFRYAGASEPSKTFTATSKATVPVTGSGEVGGDVAEGTAVTKVSAGNGITCAIANMYLYCSGMRLDARMANGVSSNDYYPIPYQINTGGLANKFITDVQVNSYNHCAIANGQSYCWGKNNLSQAGNGAVQTYVGPTMPDSISGHFDRAQTRIASPGKSWDNGFQYSCFLNQLRVFCSGGNNVGQLGRPWIQQDCSFFVICGPWYIRNVPHYTSAVNNAGVSRPQQVYGYATGLESGQYATTALLSESNLYRTRPTHLEAGAYSACALVNARIACWGDRFVGVEVDIAGFPADIGNVKASSGWRGGTGQLVTAMGVGESTSCFVANGELYCWGFRPGNGSRKATVGGVENASFPHERWNVTKVPNGSGTELNGVTIEGYHSHSDEHMCAYGDGDAYCWGPGVASTNRNTPSRIIAEGDSAVPSPSITDVSAGHSHICVVANGSQYCRGVNTGGVNYGVLGTGGTTNHTSSNTTVKASEPSSGTSGIGLTKGEAATKIASGANHSCGIANNYVYCWGRNDRGQLGDGTTLQRNQPTGINVKELPDFKTRAATHIATGDSHSCAIVSGEVYCWGRNNYGQLGIGSTADSTTPKKVTLPGNYKATSIDAGAEHTCAIANGRAYCWGRNDRGQLGNGSSTGNATSPVGVSNLSHSNPNPASVDIPTHITTGAKFSCAIANAYAYCWGDNSYGQIGRANSTDRYPSPQRIEHATDLGWVSLDAGDNFVCGIIERAARCWGQNERGQLGRNTTSAYEATPATVMSTVSNQHVGVKYSTAISAGQNHACAIANGEAHCWGDNSYGKMGHNESAAFSSVSRLVVRQANFLRENNIYAISAGGSHTCGVANAKIMCWGRNNHGQLGNTTTADSSTPTLQGKYIREARTIDVTRATIF